MIKSIKPLSLAEANELVGTGEDKKDIKNYMKKFNQIKADKAKKLREEIENLKNIKIKANHIVKIIDMLPKDEEDVNKIFTDINLDENETNKIIEIVKNYK